MRVSLCNPGWSGTCYVYQVGLKLSFRGILSIMGKKNQQQAEMAWSRSRMMAGHTHSGNRERKGSGTHSKGSGPPSIPHHPVSLHLLRFNNLPPRGDQVFNHVKYGGHFTFKTQYPFPLRYCSNQNDSLMLTWITTALVSDFLWYFKGGNQSGLDFVITSTGKTQMGQHWVLFITWEKLQGLKGVVYITTYWMEEWLSG